MNSTLLFTNISLLLCGLSLFLYGMQQGEKYLRKIGGNDLKRIISIVTKNRFSAYISGLVMTLTTQSSSATTVMLVGLVSSGFMTIGQALGMILGSDIGTTITVQLFAIKFQKLAPLIITAGFTVSLIAKSTTVKGYGKLFLSLGLIFFGMEMMSQAAIPLVQNSSVNDIFQQSLTNPFIGLLIGTILTALIHSSAATLAILIGVLTALQQGGNLPVHIDIFSIVMGANLGTCSTAFLTMLGTSSASGQRVAWAHFLFKTVGVLILFPVALFFPVSGYIQTMPFAVQVAMLHTAFNIFISILILPLTHVFEKLLLRIVREKAKSSGFSLEFIAAADAAIPSIALSQAQKEIMRMAENISQMLQSGLELLEKYRKNIHDTIMQKEELIDFLRENIIAFLVRISHEELQPSQARKTHELVMIASDFENMADIVSRRITLLVEKIATNSIPLSADGKGELVQFYSETIQKFRLVSAAMVDREFTDTTIFSGNALGTGETYIHLFERHLERLFKKTPESLQTTSIHVDLLDEIRRIHHYTDRIAAHIVRMNTELSGSNPDVEPVIM